MVKKKKDFWDHRPTQTALEVWFSLLKAMRVEMRAAGLEADDITDVTWALREIEMDRRQMTRAAYVKRYRPIQTLDGLDPAPYRAFMRELANGFRVMITRTMARPG